MSRSFSASLSPSFPSTAPPRPFPLSVSGGAASVAAAPPTPLLLPLPPPPLAVAARTGEVRSSDAILKEFVIVEAVVQQGEGMDVVPDFAQYTDVVNILDKVSI